MKSLFLVLFSSILLCVVSQAAMQQKVHKDSYSCTFTRGTASEVKSSPAILYYESGMVGMEIGDSNGAMSFMPPKRKELLDLLSKYKGMAEKVEKVNVSQNIAVGSLKNNYFFFGDEKNPKNVAKLIKYDIRFVSQGNKGNYSYFLEISYPKVSTEGREPKVMEKVTVYLNKDQVADLLKKLSDETVKKIGTDLRSGDLKPSPIEKTLIFDI